MASFVPSSPETIEDRRLYTEARLVEVACLDCLARVRVKKNSEHQTSVQWTAEAQDACPELVRRRASPERSRTFHHGCPRMSASIDAAVADGRIQIGAEDGY